LSESDPLVSPDPLAHVGRRSETEADVPFLLELYASTREQELSLVDWPAEQKRAFVAQQFRAQREHYRRAYHDGLFQVLETGGQSIGRLYVHHGPSEVRIVDITIAPAFRGHGIGRALLLEILADAARTGRAVTIHVERFNPARRLYDRLGFLEISDDGVYSKLEARP